MDRNTIIARLAAILTTLAEPDVQGTPESLLYILCDMNITDYETLRDIMVKLDWISISGNYVTITATGREKAAQIEEAMNNAKGGQ